MPHDPPNIKPPRLNIWSKFQGGAFVLVGGGRALCFGRKNQDFVGEKSKVSKIVFALISNKMRRISKEIVLLFEDITKKISIQNDSINFLTQISHVFEDVTRLSVAALGGAL